MLPLDPTDCASCLATYWKWVIKTSRWQQNNRTGGSTGSLGSPDSQQDDRNVILLKLVPAISGCSYVIDGSALVDFYTSEDDTGELNIIESRKCIILGLLYASIVYEQSTPDHQTIPEDNQFDNCSIPSCVRLILPPNISTDGNKLILFLDHLWQMLNTNESGDISRIILSVICLLSTRFSQLEPLYQLRFLAGGFAWTFNRLVGDAQTSKADDEISFESALLHVLLRLSTSTFSNEDEVAPIKTFCEFILKSSPDGSNPFLIWLSNSSLSLIGSSDSSTLRVFLSVLLFWRALCWVRVDGISTESLSSNQTTVGLSPIAVAARQRAVLIITKMWSFRLFEGSGVKNNIESTVDTAVYPFRRSICFLMGRQLIFLLSDVGRISDIHPILKFLLEPCPHEWLSFIESAQNGEDLDVPSDQKSESQLSKSMSQLSSDLINQRALHFLMKRSKISGGNDKAKELTESVGLSFGVVVPSAPDLRRPVQPPRFQILLEGRETNKKTPILVMLMMIPASLELGLLMFELPTLHTLSYLSTQADPRTVRHCLQWIISSGTRSRPLDKLLLRIPNIFSALSQFHLIRNSKKSQITSTQPTISTSKSSEDLWDSELFSVGSESIDASPPAPQTSTPALQTAPSPPTMCGIGESEVSRQLFLALECVSSLHPPTAISRARTALLEVVVFKHFHNAFKVHLELSRRRRRKMSSSEMKETEAVELYHPESKEQPIATEGLVETQECIVKPIAVEEILKEPELPGWVLYRILQEVCFNESHPSDMICSWIYQFTVSSSSQIVQLNQTVERSIPIHPTFAPLLQFLSLFVQRWSEQLGPVVLTSLTLNFFEFSVQQLKAEGKLPTLDSAGLSALSLSTASPRLQTQQMLSAYYSAICRETLVGRLLILCGIEPQFLLTPPQTAQPRGTFWLVNAEARRTLRFSLSGLSVLEELGLTEAPFTNVEFPVGRLLLNALNDAFLLLMLRLPTLWPSERLLTAVTAELNSQIAV